MQSKALCLVLLTLFVVVFSMTSETQDMTTAALYQPHYFQGKEWEDYFETSALVASQFGSLKGSFAVDVASSLTSANWNCFSKTAKIGIPRGYRSVGAVDTNLAQNVHNMQAADGGYTASSTQTYFFPCIKNCPSKSMATQFNELWTHLTEQKLQVDFIWLDIEEVKYWYEDKFSNQMKFEQLLSAARAKNAAFGIYTSKNNWSEIFGLDYKLGNQPPLWYAHYTGKANCDTFVPFGGFTKALLHQYYGDKTEPCGIDHDMSIYC